MKTSPLQVHLMTAGLAPGDAISSYVLSQAHILRRWGAKVNIYADHIAPVYGSIAQHARFYRDTGEALLWFHYSLYTDNVEQARASKDFKIMDYHGICPPRLFAGQNSHLETLCARGIEVLPSLKAQFDSYVAHSAYTQAELRSLGFPAERVHKLSLSVNRAISGETADAELVTQLSRLTYFLLVGRMVPQKDILALIEIFAHIHHRRPDIVLILVGSREHTPRYQRQIDDLIAAKGLTNRIIFTGQVNNPAVLAALFSQASLLFVTSEWESFCVPIAESLFFGVPAVVHDVPPLPEVAGPAGLVVDKRRPSEAAEQVLALLDDEVHYRRLQRAAGKWAEQYTDQALGRNMLALLKQIFSLSDQETYAH